MAREKTFKAFSFSCKNIYKNRNTCSVTGRRCVKHRCPLIEAFKSMKVR